MVLMQHLPTQSLQRPQACAYFVYGNSHLNFFFLTPLANLILVLSVRYSQRDGQKTRKVPALSTGTAPHPG